MSDSRLYTERDKEVKARCDMHWNKGSTVLRKRSQWPLNFKFVKITGIRKRTSSRKLQVKTALP